MSDALGKVDKPVRIAAQASQAIFGRGGKQDSLVSPNKMSARGRRLIQAYDDATKSQRMKTMKPVKRITGAITEMERQNRDATIQMIAANEEGYLGWLKLVNDLKRGLLFIVTYLGNAYKILTTQLIPAFGNLFDAIDLKERHDRIQEMKDRLESYKESFQRREEWQRNFREGWTRYLPNFIQDFLATPLYSDETIQKWIDGA